MCFGNSETGSQNKSYDPNPTVAGGATGNINFVQGLENKGPQAYGGQFVAPFSDQQKNSFGMANDLSQTPMVGQAGQYINNYGSAGPSSVNAQTIASRMNPYMNAYVQQSLAPQLENWQQNVAQQNRGAASNSTMAGAFGNDAQDALYRSNLTNQQNIGLTGLVGNAYNSAFNTAIGAGAQDVSNNLNAQTTNAGLNEQALQRQMGAAQGLQGLIGTQSNLANLQNAFGQQQTAATQGGLNAQYSDWLRQQQQPYQAAALMNQTVSAGSQAMPASQQTQNYAPNNSGYALLGAIGPAMLGFADGGAPPVGVPSMVGERGPELFQPQSGDAPSVVGAGGPSFMTPNQPGTVIPNEQIAGGTMPDVPPSGVLPSQTLNGAVGLPPTGMMPSVGGPTPPTGMMGTAPGGPTGMMQPAQQGPTGAMPPAVAPTGAMGTAPQQSPSGLLGAVGGLNNELNAPPVAPTGAMPPAGGVPPSGQMGTAPGQAGYAPPGFFDPAPGMPGGMGGAPTGQMPPAPGVAPTGQMGTAPGLPPLPPGVTPPPVAPTGQMPTAPQTLPTGAMPPAGEVAPNGQMPTAGPPAPTGAMPPAPIRPTGQMGTAPQTAPTGAMGTAPQEMQGALGAPGPIPNGQMNTAPPPPLSGQVAPTGAMPPANNVTPIRPTGAMPTGMATAFGQAA